jgi:PAS domain S-box-containing protein
MKAIYGKTIKIGGSLLDYMTVSEDREKAKRNIDRALTGEGFVEAAYSGEETRSRLYFEVSLDPITAKSGAIIGVAVVARDTTERKKMKKTLWETEEKYRAMVEDSPNLIGIFQDGALRYVNNAATKLGWTFEELVSPSFDPIENVVSQKSRSLLKENVGKNLRGEDVAPYEINLTRKDGSEVQVLATGAKVIYNHKPAIEFVFNDITERKRAEEKFRESEERFHSLFDQMLDGVYRSTHEGRFVDVNPAFVKMFGYSSKQETLAITDIRKELYFSPEDRASHDLRPGDKEKVETYRMRRKDGSEIWVEDHGHFVHDERGNIIYHEGILRDVTERKRMEEGLRESEEKYRGLVENSSDFVGILQDGTLRYVNRTAVERLGWTYDELVSPSIDPVEKVVAERFRGLVKENVGKRLRGEVVPSYEISLTARDGSEIPVMVRASKIVYQGRPAVEFVFSDIAERKRMEEELSRSNQFLGSVIENAYVWLNVLDNQQNVLVWNKAAETLSGYSREKVLGHGEVWEWLYPDQEYRKQITETVNAVLQSGRTDVDSETRIKRKDGQARIISWNERALTDQDGKAIGTIAIGHDITERRQLEEELKRYSEHLQELVDERTQALRESEKTTRRQAGQLAALDEMVLEITKTTDATKLLDTIVERAVNLLEAEGGGMYLCEPEKLEVRNVVAYKTYPVTGTVLKYGEGAAGTVAKTGQPLIIYDYSTWPGRAHVFDNIQYRAVLSAPLIWQGQVTGVVNVLGGESHRFTQNDIKLLNRLANHAAIALHRKQTEELMVAKTLSLRESETRYRTLVENIPEKIFTKKMNSTYVSCNDHFARDLDLSPEQVAGKTDYDFFPRELADSYRAMDKNVLESGKTEEVEERYVLKGKETFVDTIKTPIRDLEGHVTGLLGIFRDVTERRNLEEELRSTKERLEYVVASNPAVIYSGKPLADLSDWEMTYLSESVIGMLGYEPGVFIGHQDFWSSILHPEDRVSVMEQIPSLWKEGRLALQYRMRHKDGGYRWIREEATVARGLDGKPVEVSGYWTDVTARKQAELALEESEGRYRRLFESSPISLWEEDFSEVKKYLDELRGGGVKDFRTYFLKNPEEVARCLGFVKILDVNQATLTLYGAESVSEFRGGLSTVITKESLDKVGEEIVALAEGKTRFESELMNQTLGGDMKHVRLFVSVVPGYEDTLGKVLVSVIDLTEHKLMEERLLKSERLAAIGQTTAMVGHDLRNPLQGMTGALYLAKNLLRSERVEDRKEAVELLDTMDSQIVYMDKIVSDLHSYSGPAHAEPVETNLPNLVRGVILNAHVPGNVETHVEVQGELSSVMVDDRLLQRVLENLIMNAVQAMPKGGNLTVVAHKELESVTITVEDTGEGIARENMDKIFNPFFTTKAKGQGLGLAASKRLLEAQNGIITVRSEVGKGSTFTLSIPTSKVSRAVEHGEADPSHR